MHVSGSATNVFSRPLHPAGVDDGGAGSVLLRDARGGIGAGVGAGVGVGFGTGAGAGRDLLHSVYGHNGGVSSYSHKFGGSSDDGDGGSGARAPLHRAPASPRAGAHMARDRDFLEEHRRFLVNIRREIGATGSGAGARQGGAGVAGVAGGSRGGVSRPLGGRSRPSRAGGTGAGGQQQHSGGSRGGSVGLRGATALGSEAKLQGLSGNAHVGVRPHHPMRLSLGRNWRELNLSNAPALLSP